MLKTELSPLMNKTDRTNSKCRIIGNVFILILCIIAAFLCYDTFTSSSHISSLHHLFMATDKQLLPTQAEIDEYRSKSVYISYSTHDVPETANIDEFHNNLIREHGYNLNDDINVHFFAMDPDDNELEADGVSDNLRCGTVMTKSTNAGFMEINCGDKFNSPKMKITGCVSLEANGDGTRYGETGSDSSDCMTMAMDTTVTELSGRCCRVRGSAKLSTSISIKT